jgi:sarcosine oxidase
VNKSYNTIVVGLGAMGSATLYQLAQRGISALGIDRLSPPHTLGSTHGDTRITRQAIGEGEHYTPLSLRSYEIFRELESKSNSKLLEITGGLIISSESDAASINHTPGFFPNTLAAAKKYGIKHEVLSAPEIRKRFPQFNVDDDENAYYEYEAAFLRPEEVVRSQLRVAQELGAAIHTNETVSHFEETDLGVTVYTDQGTYKAEHLVLSVGPWLPEILTDLGAVFKVHRQVLYWFDIATAYKDFVPGKFPIFIWQIKGRENGIYGFPAVDGPSGGFKIASEQYIDQTTPDSVDRIVSAEETASMFESKVAPFFPRANATCVKSAVCLYTVTPDSGFVIDWLPNSERVVICSPCSGHGFKHSAAIGECVAELVTIGHSKIDISPFRLDRLRAPYS